MNRPTRLLWILLALLVSFPVSAADDRAEYPSCKYCGMHRQMFAHSRMYLEYDDGTVAATCSLHCAAVELALVIDKIPTAIRVGDYNTKELIDAETAHWVIGGDQMGVMTRNAKWAFEKEEDARAFVGKHGGTLASFDQAMEAAYRDMYSDTKMIRAKRKKMRDSKP